MCYLIQVAVPTNAADHVTSPRAFHVGAHRNPSVQQLVGPEYALFEISDGGCSCNLYSSPRPAESGDNRADKLRRKYAKLGWSEAKIQRALADSETAKEQSKHGPDDGLRADVAKYLAELADRFDEVKVVVHSFRGSFVDETVTSGGSDTRSTRELRESGAGIRENVVYAIRRHPSAT